MSGEIVRFRFDILQRGHLRAFNILRNSSLFRNFNIPKVIQVDKITLKRNSFFSLFFKQNSDFQKDLNRDSVIQLPLKVNKLFFSFFKS